MNNKKYLDKNDYDFYTIDLGKIPPFTSSKTIEKNFNEDYTQCDILYNSSNDDKKVNKNDEFKILFRTLSMNNLTYSDFYIQYNNTFLSKL